MTVTRNGRQVSSVSLTNGLVLQSESFYPMTRLDRLVGTSRVVFDSYFEEQLLRHCADSVFLHVPKLSLGCVDVARLTATGTVRSKKLPSKHVFEDFRLFCCYLGMMLDHYFKDEHSPLCEKNRWANSFFVRTDGVLCDVLLARVEEECGWTWSIVLDWSDDADAIKRRRFFFPV